MARTVKAGSKDLRALVRCLPSGCRLVADGKSKANIERDGELVRYADGRKVTVPNTPAPGSVRDLRRRLEDLGLVT